VLLASISWSVFEKRLNLLKRHFPYVVPRDHRPAASFAHAGNPVDWVHGGRDHPSAVHARASRGDAFQTSDLQ
jgi:hypothetical protein